MHCFDSTCKDFRDHLLFSISAPGKAGWIHFDSHLTVDFFFFCPGQVHRLLSLSFLCWKSKGDTLNALNDMDLNLLGVRVIWMWVCVGGTEARSGGARRRGRWSAHSDGAQNKGASYRSALSYNTPQGSLSDCVTENRWTASVFYMWLSIMIYNAILLRLPPRHNLCCSFEGGLLGAIVPGRLWSA